MINRRKFRTEQARARERVRILVRASLALVGVCGVLATVAWALSSQPMRINSIKVSTDGEIHNDDLQATIERVFAGTHAWFIPNDSILFSGMETVQAELANSFPRIAHVELKREGLRTLNATVRERIPTALWCGDVVPEIVYRNSQEQDAAREDVWGTCYLLDENGFIYANALSYTGTMFIRYYGSLENAVPVGQNFIASDEFYTWQNFVRDLTDDGFTVRGVLFVDERDCELYLDDGLRILIPRYDSFTALRNRLASLMADRVIDTSRSIEYVDLRFGGKAFVKYLEIPEE